MPGTHTRWVRFVGQNVKGNPAMSFRKVVHDLRVVRRHADVAVLQEFEWRWYWRALGRVLAIGLRWGSYPGRLRGAAHPVRGAQAVIWRRGPRWLQRGRRFQKLLHKGYHGISDDRWLRAAELIDRVTGLAFIAGTTHNVVGGDGPQDGKRRRDMLAGDLQHLAEFLDELIATGLAIVFEIDGNIHRLTAAYQQLRKIVESRGGAFYGDLGVEYLFVIPGRNGTKIEVHKNGAWVIPDSELYTDHEGRGLTFRVAA